jgi:hypothetical protein
VTGAEPRPVRCGSYRTGHDVHHIAARMFVEDEARGATTAGLVLGVEDGFVVLAVGDRRLRLWNHDPGRVARAARRCGRDARLSRRLSLLALPPAGRCRPLFSVAFRRDGGDPPVTACAAPRACGR